MPAHGTILTTADVHGKAVRVGSVSVIITDLTKAVAFGTAAPNANYKVFLQVEGSLAVVLWATSKTTAGFTLNLSVGVVGDISYLAVET